MADVAYALDLETGKLVTLALASVSALFADKSTDTLFAASGTTATAVGAGALRSSGTWKKRFVTEKYESYAWLYVESDFKDADGVTAASVTVTVADADGTTLATATVSNRDPVRLAPFCEREVIVTVSGKPRTTRVVLASSTEELQRL